MWRAWRVEWVLGFGTRRCKREENSWNYPVPPGRSVWAGDAMKLPREKFGERISAGSHSGSVSGFEWLV